MTKEAKIGLIVIIGIIIAIGVFHATQPKVVEWFDPVDCEYQPSYSYTTTDYIDDVPMTNYHTMPEKWFIYYGVKFDNGTTGVKRVQVDKSQYNDYRAKLYRREN